MCMFPTGERRSYDHAATWERSIVTQGHYRIAASSVGTLRVVVDGTSEADGEQMEVLRWSASGPAFLSNPLRNGYLLTSEWEPVESVLVSQELLPYFIRALPPPSQAPAVPNLFRIWSQSQS